MDGQRKNLIASGITRRWVLNELVPIIVMLILAEAVFAAIFSQSVYNSLSEHLTSRAQISAEFFNRYVSRKPQEFFNSAKKYIEDFPDSSVIEMQIIDNAGHPVYSSSGFVTQNPQMLDYTAAVKSGTGKWVGTDADTGQKVMAVSRIIFDDSNLPLGAIRFLISLDSADKYIFFATLASLGVVLAILLFVALSSAYFLRSIVGPVAEINKIASKIAKGSLDVRIEKRYNDEVGQLADTINNMAHGLEETDRLKNDFISSISHEIRTPLTAIKGWSETVRDQGMQDPVTLKKGIGVIIKETDRLSSIVEELLDFSRLESGRMKMRFDKFDLLTEFEESAFLFMEKAKRENINFEYNLPEDIPQIVGDKARIKQVFVNVFDNALKYTPEGGKITVKMEYDGTYITTVIADSGAGIPPEELPHVKEKFFKGSSSKRGSGIGLAVCDEIMKLHGGSLDVQSEVGAGTTVIIKLPLEPYAANE